jgi:hypothetical protein
MKCDVTVTIMKEKSTTRNLSFIESMLQNLIEILNELKIEIEKWIVELSAYHMSVLMDAVKLIFTLTLLYTHVPMDNKKTFRYENSVDVVLCGSCVGCKFHIPLHCHKTHSPDIANAIQNHVLHKIFSNFRVLKTKKQLLVLSLLTARDNMTQIIRVYRMGMPFFKSYFRLVPDILAFFEKETNIHF